MLSKWLTDKEIKLLSENGFDVSIEWDKEALIDALDEAVIDNIVSHGDEPDAIGLALERIFDRLAYED